MNEENQIQARVMWIISMIVLLVLFYIDSNYQKIFEKEEDKKEFDKIYDEFSDKIDALEKKLYMNTDFDVWSLLYKYLMEQINRG